MSMNTQRTTDYEIIHPQIPFYCLNYPTASFIPDPQALLRTRSLMLAGYTRIKDGWAGKPSLIGRLKITKGRGHCDGFVANELVMRSAEWPRDDNSSF